MDGQEKSSNIPPVEQYKNKELQRKIAELYRSLGLDDDFNKKECKTTDYYPDYSYNLYR